jgi:small subunit ribosomal protein S16
VAANRESPRDGRFIEILGDYNPRTEPSTIRTKEDRIYYWLSVGAQPSDAVLQIFRVVGLMERYQRYKDGEDIEVLVAEGKQVEKDRNVDPRTRRDDLVKVGSPKKKEESVEEVTVDADAVADVPDAEAEAVDAEAEAETPDAETEADVPDAVAEPAAEEVEEQEVQETEAVVPDAEAEAEVIADEEPQAEEVVDAEALVEEVADEEAAVTDEEPQAEVEEEVVVEEQVEVEEAPVEETVETKIKLKITDAARKLAEENGIDLSTVKGTGKDGTILKSDISKLIKD